MRLRVLGWESGQGTGGKEGQAERGAEEKDEERQSISGRGNASPVDGQGGEGERVAVQGKAVQGRGGLELQVEAE